MLIQPQDKKKYIYYLNKSDLTKCFYLAKFTVELHSILIVLNKSGKVFNQTPSSIQVISVYCSIMSMCFWTPAHISLAFSGSLKLLSFSLSEVVNLYRDMKLPNYSKSSIPSYAHTN